MLTGRDKMELSKKAFKAYDIRGIVPGEVNAELAYRVGRVFAAMFAAETAVVGHDIRLTGPELANAVADGLRDGGCTVYDIGGCGTEMVYYATAHLNTDGGIMVTASHNPADYNGMKLVRSGARPVSSDTGLMDIGRMATEEGEFPHVVVAGKERGKLIKKDTMPDYIEHLLSYIDVKNLKPLKIVANPGNGGAGPVLAKLAEHLPFEFIKINETPDGSFPNGVPNPLLEHNRAVTADKVVAEKADLGIAWDGDFDRCFFYDNEGNFIEGYYLVGLLASELLPRFPGARIIYDTRVYWNTRELIQAGGGIPVMGKTGHAFMKERMRAEDAVYGGEMSAHHYFRDFAYCDSGMLPWMLVIAAMQRHGKPLAELVRERMDAWPCSGEINRRVADAPALMRKIRDHYAPAATYEDAIDGVNLEFGNWRFNLRMSNTEPLLRLNVESRADRALLEEKTAELLALIDAGL